MELINLLSTSQTWLLVMVGLFSLLIGSFLNVVIYRLPIMLERQWKQDCQEWQNDAPAEVPTSDFNLVVPRSECPTCGHRISAWKTFRDSYPFLRGKCAGVKPPISIQYPLIELATALLSVLMLEKPATGQHCPRYSVLPGCWWR